MAAERGPSAAQVGLGAPGGTGGLPALLEPGVAIRARPGEHGVMTSLGRTRTALVTGSTSGIGAATARTLAA
ncbi:MAG TPA: hypothetical protein VFR88_16175, partial [Microlunatus sp.]|nr:hypothetical protein [Microlunatus sp.]